MFIRPLLIILGLFVLLQLLARAFRKLFPFPATAFMGPILDSTVRRFLQPPDKVIQRSGIKEGMHVLEIGCGGGALTISAAREVGEKGKVSALDIQMGMLKQLQRKLLKSENQDVKNVDLIQASAYELPIEEDALDLVYMVTVLQEIPDRRRALREARRVLNPGGALSVTEFLPDPDYPLSSTTIKMGQEADFVLDRASGNFWNYTVRFVKS